MREDRTVMEFPFQDTQLPGKYVRVSYTVASEPATLKTACPRCRDTKGVRQLVTVLSVFREKTRENISSWSGNWPIETSNGQASLAVVTLRSKYNMGHPVCANEECQPNRG